MSERTAMRVVHDDLALAMRREFERWPALRLTRAQVRRLWSLDAATCNAVLEALVWSGFLQESPRGPYGSVFERATSWQCCGSTSRGAAGDEAHGS